ncbi:hypothetical protein J2S89_000537 [Arthrobacter bambusae]|nr:hypothetical protein [Arthrobacter bambusae]
MLKRGGAADEWAGRINLGLVALQGILAGARPDVLLCCDLMSV